MALYLPDIPDIRLGDTGVKKIMLGDTLVWPRRHKIMERLISLDQIPDPEEGKLFGTPLKCVLMNDDVHCRIMGNYDGSAYNYQYGPNTTLSDSGITDTSDWILFEVFKFDNWPGTFEFSYIPWDFDPTQGHDVTGTTELYQYLSNAGMGAWGFGNDGTGLIYPSDVYGNIDTNIGYIVQSSTHLDKDGNRRAVRVGQLPTDPPMYLYILS